MLGMLKKIQAAKEFSMRATMKRKLYRQGKTTAVTLVSRTHLMEALNWVLFIFCSSVHLEERGQMLDIQNFTLGN